MERTTFVFCTKWADNIADFPPEVRLEVYEAVIRFAQNGEEPTLSETAKMAFVFIRPQLIESLTRFDNAMQQRSEAGRKAANKRWQNMPTDNERMRTHTNACERMREHTTANGRCMSNEYMSNENNITPTKVGVSDRVSDATVAEPNRATYAEEFVKFFNAEMENAGALIKPIRSMQGRRLTLLNARVNQYGKEAVAEAIRRAARSDFLNGRTKDAVIYGIDWILKPNNFPKVLEGNYDNRTKSNQNEQRTTHFTDSRTAAAERAAENEALNAMLTNYGRARADGHQ